MVILQPWEPSISPEFPSQIPFWIDVQGVPVHLWNEAILRGIGEDIGTFDVWEITPSKARLRAFVNGLRPLIFNSTLEFANGDEVTASLVYEKLEKHCKLCFMLDHQKEDCLLNTSRTNPTNSSHETSKVLPREHSLSKQKNHISAKPSSKEQEYRQPSGFMRDARKADSGYRTFSPRRHNFENASYDESKRYNRSVPGSKETPYHPSRSSRHHSPLEKSRSRWVDTGRRLTPSGHSQSRERQPLTSTARDCDAPGEQREAPLHRGSNLEPEASAPINAQNNIFSPSLDKSTEFDKVTCEAREELKEYMTQYASCADPSESAARKERMRLAEEKGETEEVVRNMVATSIALNANQLNAEELNATGTTPLRRSIDLSDNSPGRIPALNRLGPPTDPIISPSEPVEGRIPAKKRLGRPPLAKKQSKPLGVNASSNVKKRRVTQVRISPKRRTAPSSSTRGAGARRSTSATQDAQAQTGTQSVDSQPRARIIPGIVKRKVDFQNPLAPVP